VKINTIVGWPTRLAMKLRHRFKKPLYYVCSEEPFTAEPIWRGPFTRKDAMSLIAINSACGSIDRLYEELDGMLVPL